MSAPTIRFAIVLDELLKWQGGAEYVRNLLLAMRERQHRSPGEQVVTLVLSTDPVSDRIKERYRPLADEWHTGLREQSSWSGSIHLDLLRLKATLAFPLYHDERNQVRYAHWIYDFQHKALASMFTPAELAERDRGVADAIRFAESIVVSSAACQRDLARHYPGADARSHIIHFATFPNEDWFLPDPSETATAYHLPERYLIACNQFWQHKNHLDIFEAMARLKDGGTEVELVCTGPVQDYRQPDFINSILDRIHRLGLARHVRLLGLLPRTGQIQLVRQSIGIVQPSSFEGWSTVVEDARTLGKDIVLSDIDVHREQAPPGARFFRCGDTGDLANALAELWRAGRPGPCPERENQARADALTRARRFADAFVTLAHQPRPPMLQPSENPAPAARSSSTSGQADASEIQRLRDQIARLDEDRRIKAGRMHALDLQIAEKQQRVMELAAACQQRDAEYEEVFRLRHSRWMKLGWRLGFLPRLIPSEPKKLPQA
jgi:glycosyltransferase involved in cell wall biosynthesis